MKIGVMTWNINCSPIMYNRLKTKKRVQEEISNNHHHADILLLQESGPFRVGFISYTIYRLFRLIFDNIPILLMFWDYLMVFESNYLPSIVYDNHHDMIKYAHSLGFKHAHVSKDPDKYVSSGLLILSKYPITKRIELLGERDAVHVPGIIGVEINVKGKTYQVLTCHLVPTLRGPKISYGICNIWNFLLRKNTHRMRQKHLLDISHKLNKKRVIFAGDFNIVKKDKKEYEIMLEILGLKDTTKAELSTFKWSFYQKQIDYILISKDLKAISSHTLHLKPSDHNPLFSFVE